LRGALDTRLRWGIAGALALAGLVAWLRASPFGEDLVAEIALFAIFAMSVDLLAGGVGLMSIGQASFFGLGGYVTAILTAQWGWTGGVAMLASIAAGIAVAGLVGCVIVRFNEITFILLTLSLGQMFSSYVGANRALGGSDGIPGVGRIDLSGIGLDSTDPSVFCAMVLMLTVVAFVAVDALVRSRFGLVAAAVRRNPSRARALGANLTLVRTTVYALSGGIAALAGSLLGQLNGYVSPDLTSWTLSGSVLIMVLLGGLGSISGAALGAVLVQTASHYVSRVTSYWGLLLGLLFICVVLFAENGVTALLRALALRVGRPRMASSGKARVAELP